MDHDPLTPLFSPLTALKGVGPAAAALIAKAAGGERLIDLLFHLPEAYIDRRRRCAVARARPGEIVTLAVEVTRHEPPAMPQQPHRILARDASGAIELAYFRRPPPRTLAIGATCLVSGKVSLFNGLRQLNPPDYVEPIERQDRFRWIDPVWPLTDRLHKWQVAAAMAAALARVPSLPEWHDAALLRREKWPDFATALRAVQAPSALPAEAPRLRLAYDELLADQVALALVRGRLRARPGRSLTGDGELRAKALSRFGYTLTRSQQQALAEIDADLASNRRMLRLLQGDVGSGKTLVALLAMLRAVEAGRQTAMMAPTEVLAKQHHRTLSRLSPAPVALLTGGVKGRARAQLLRGLKDGSVPLVVGTHALFQESVEYHDLALAVIDEQHRFGVDQRLLLGGKGELTDVLVMTATPIPRTLLLTQWGEMETSRLTEKPPGRQSVRTSLHALGTLPDLLDALARKLDEGAQVYWICPLVAESEAVDLAAAEARFAVLRERFGGGPVGLAHGRQDAAVRDATLAAFAEGKCRLLVATTVVEVGVDVPAATIMVIEHAERFGLAQLHQLRGRVGRGAAASFCLLLHEDWVNEAARRRLTLLRDTDDGFVIADEDFRLRGGGDVLGTKQSGLPGFRLADPIEHEALLHMANRDAAVLLSKDPKLVSERGRAVRVLLRLFEKAAAMRTLAAG
ncbi:MAG TPA: ATP-dependent DNA helicase RecG [Acetobacteraceae bacterium]